MRALFPIITWLLFFTANELQPIDLQRETTVVGLEIASDPHNVLSADQKSDTEVDPKTWEVVTLEMPTAEDAHVQVLRAPEWVKEHHAIQGTRIWFEWNDIRLEGWATVEDVKPVGHIAEEGKGRVVTATINHDSHSIYKLTLNRGESIEATGIHRFYSETMHDWVHLSDLKIGEQLHSRGDQVNLVVTNLQKETDHKQVYNLEVEIEHHYYVGSEQVLVHNSYRQAAGRRICLY